MPLYGYDDDLCYYYCDGYAEDEFPYDEFDIVKVIRNASPWNFRCLQTTDRTPILVKSDNGFILNRDKFDYGDELEILYDRYKDTSYIPDAILETIKMVVDKHKSIATWTEDEEYYIVRGSNRGEECSLDVISHCGDEVLTLDGLYDLLEDYLEYGKEYSVSSLRPLSEGKED